MKTKNNRTNLARLAAVLVLAVVTSATAWGHDITIASAEDWMGFCKDVAGGNTYSGKTVMMTEDVCYKIAKIEVILRPKIH